MSVLLQQRTAYGLSDALLNVPMLPIIASRAPTTNDMAALGTIWVYKAQNIAYILTSVVNNEADWVNITQAAGDFVRYSVQTVNAVPTAIATFSLAPSSSINIFANINCSQSNFASGLGGYMDGSFRRAAVGAPVSIGFINPNVVEDQGALTVGFAIVGNDIQLQVTGVAATVYNWTADITTIINS